MKLLLQLRGVANKRVEPRICRKTQQFMDSFLCKLAASKESSGVSQLVGHGPRVLWNKFGPLRLHDKKKKWWWCWDSTSWEPRLSRYQHSDASQLSTVCGYQEKLLSPCFPGSLLHLQVLTPPVTQCYIFSTKKTKTKEVKSVFNLFTVSDWLKVEPPKNNSLGWNSILSNLVKLLLTKTQ